jgi:DNA polymerase III subunit epsilon
MTKQVFIDFEATGKNPELHEPTQMGGVYVDDKGEVEFKYYCQPTNWEIIEPEALKVQGVTLEELRTYPSTLAAFNGLIVMLESKIDRFNPKDKADIIAFNASYDASLLYGVFRKYSPDEGKYKKYNVGNYFVKNALCVMQAYRFCVDRGLFQMPDNFRLETLCNIHGIDLKAHDALEDAKATRKLYEVVCKRFTSKV